MSILSWLGVVFLAFLLFMAIAVTVSWRKHRLRSQKTPDVKINPNGIMTEEQIQAMIDGINRRIAEEKDQISPELLKAMFEVRKKFQNALNEMKKNNQ